MSFFEEFIETGAACRLCHTMLGEDVGYMRECPVCKQKEEDRAKAAKASHRSSHRKVLEKKRPQ